MTTSPTTIKYYFIPSAVAEHKELSPTAKLVYGVLRFHRGKSGKCCPSTQTIAQEARCSVRAVGKAISQLAELKLIWVFRRFKSSNSYALSKVDDFTGLRISEAVLDLPGLTSLQRLVLASVAFKSRNDDGQAWPYQQSLATELGCSLRSITNALPALEGKAKAKDGTAKPGQTALVEVVHRGGGRSIGNYYRPTGAAPSYPAQNAQFGNGNYAKRAEQKINNSQDGKESPTRSLPSAALSGCRLTGSTQSHKPASTAQEQAEERLRRVGVHPAVAASLVWDQHHPPASIEQAVNNALLRQASHRQAGLDRLKPFSAAAYVVGSLNQARKEAHLVKPSRIFVAAKVKTEAKRTPWTPPSEKDFEAMRRKALAGLVARKVAS